MLHCGPQFYARRFRIKVLNVVMVVCLTGSTPEDEAASAQTSNTFMVPRREINTVPDMGKWKRSQVGRVVDWFAIKSSNIPFFSVSQI